MQNNTQQLPNDLTPGDYWEIAKRRKYWLLVPALAIFLLSLVLAFSMPPVYRATTTILIEGQQIPSNYVQSTVTEYVEKRLHTITQRVMSRSRLLEIIGQFNLYEEDKGKKTTEAIVTMMRDNIQLESITADIVDQRTGRPAEVTIAFALSFEGKNPAKVKKVADRLASLYLEENLKTREEMAEMTTTFLDSELEELRRNIDEQEDKIAAFKEKHFDSMPNMKILNIQEMQQMEKELEFLEQDLAAVKNKKIQLEGQLAGIDPDLPGIQGPEGRFADPEQQLEYLQTQYSELKATLSPKHPDLINMERTISALEQQVSISDQVHIKQNQLETLQKELTIAQSRYSDKHPDVVSLKQSIALLQKEIDQTATEKTTISNKETAAPENPAYINILTNIASAENQLQNLMAKRGRIRSRIADYKNRLAVTPQVEARFKELQRNYDDTQRRYQEVFSKLMEARTAESLERGQKGERFTIIDPAITPEAPSNQNKVAVILIGFMLGTGAGLGCAYIKEFSDQAIWSENTLAQLIGDEVLAVIPRIDLNQGAKKSKHKTYKVLAASATGGIILVLAFHLFYKPLDVLWMTIF